MPHGEHDLETAFDEALSAEGLAWPKGVKAALSRGLVEAVEFATERATDAVDRIGRRRLVRNTAIITAIVASGISIPVTYVITNENASSIRQQARQSAHRESLAACEVQSRARPQGNARAFDQLAFLTVLQDALTPRVPRKGPAQARARAFGQTEVKAITKRAAFWRQYTVIRTPEGKVIGNELPKSITSFSQLAETIKPVPLIDCRSLLR